VWSAAIAAWVITETVMFWCCHNEFAIRPDKHGHQLKSCMLVFDEDYGGDLEYPTVNDR